MECDNCRDRAKSEGEVTGPTLERLASRHKQLRFEDAVLPVLYNAAKKRGLKVWEFTRKWLSEHGFSLKFMVKQLDKRLFRCVATNNGNLTVTWRHPPQTPLGQVYQNGR